MSQHDYNIANAPGASVRADINALAEAIASNNGGSSVPSVTFPNMFWYDSGNGILNIRNPSNTAWIAVATIVGSDIKFSVDGLSLLLSGDWFGTTPRVPNVAIDGSMEIGTEIHFHPDAAGAEDYRARIGRAVGTNGVLEIENTGSGGINLIPGSGGLKVNGGALQILPLGMIAYTADTAAPSGWLLCYGQNISRTTYADLFTTIGTTFGSGNGSSTFTLPDLRGYVVAGKDNMGGTSANRLTGGVSGINGDNLGATGGDEKIALTSTQLPSHLHSFSGNTGTESADHSHNLSLGASHGANGTVGRAAYSQGDTPASMVTRTNTTSGRSASHFHAISGNTGSVGGGQEHPNVQPTIILNAIIYTGV